MGGVGGKEGELRKGRGREKVENRGRDGRGEGRGRIPPEEETVDNTAWSQSSRPGPG